MCNSVCMYKMLDCWITNMQNQIDNYELFACKYMHQPHYEE